MSDILTGALQGWQSFYQIVGESAATLTGLTFLSVTLGVGQLTIETTPFVRTFTGRVLESFLSALVISALMCIPAQTRHWLSWELAAIGLISLWRSLVLLLIVHRNSLRLRLKPHHWLWHLSLPWVGSLCILVTAVGLWRSWPPALDATALGVLLLVLAGVSNAWEFAVQALLASLQGADGSVATRS